MSTGIIGAGLSGLAAAQYGLQTTAHNIANVDTPGFSRQRAIVVSNPALQTGSGYVGQGARVLTIERLYSSFLTDQVQRSQSRSSELETYHAQISQIDNMLADTTTGLSPSLQQFFNGVQQVAANPAQLPAREAMMSSAQGLADRYQSLGNQLTEIADGINVDLRATVTSINSFAEAIASLNQQIGVAQAANGQPANDLLDTRDQLVLELNQLVQARTTPSGDGGVNVFIGNGQQLVVGSLAGALTTTPSASDPSRLAVGLKTPGGSIQEMPESLLKGGSLGGLLAFRAESLDRVTNDLGRNAASLALAFNAQSSLGQDLLGQSQLSAPPSSFTPDLFVVPPPTVIANANNPAGSPSVSAAFVKPPPFNGNFHTDLGSSDYRLSADASGLTLTRLADNRQWDGADIGAINSELASDPQGFMLASSGGEPLAGSSYLVRPTRDAARNLSVNPALAANPSLIAAAGPIRTTSGQANTGSATISAGSVGPGYADSLAALPVTLAFQGGNLQGFPAGTQVSIGGSAPVLIADPTQGVAYPSGANITLVGSAPPTGISFAINGQPGNGDTFTLVRNDGATADGRNALALAQLQTQATMSGQTASFQQAYAQLVSEVGNQTRQIEVSGIAQQSLLAQAQASREALSGVNLDEEAANLIRYQQAYQASAKAMEIGASLFNTILQIAG
ncbi:MAG: flagellar hook-associated protein FlgK [Candidatus Accumulibacter sp. UW20]|jgi:flagellar hook-associated protein 1 FlgK